jgi:hypothetical protein
LKTGIEYEDSKRKKESLDRFDSDDRASSSTPGSTIGFVLMIALVLAIIAFIIYRKRTKSIENRNRFRHTEKQFDSPPSPPTSETEQNKLSIWSALADPTQQQNLTIV